MDKGGVSNSSFLIAVYIAVIEQLGFEWILIDKGYSLMGAVYFCLPCKLIKKKIIMPGDLLQIVQIAKSGVISFRVQNSVVM